MEDFNPINDPHEMERDYDYDGYYNPPETQNADLLKTLTSYDEGLKSLLMGWLGIRWDASQEKYITDTIPKINKKGALSAINFIRTYADKNNTISHCEKEKINSMLLGITDIVYFHFMDKFEEYEIISISDAQMIITQVLDKIEICLSGLYGNKSTVDLIGNTTSLNQSISTPASTQQQQPKSFLSSMRKKIGM
jgi:hypothetical protein